MPQRYARVLDDGVVAEVWTEPEPAMVPTYHNGIPNRDKKGNPILVAIPITIRDAFHPDFAAQFRPCPDEVEANWRWTGDAFQQPLPPLIES